MSDVLRELAETVGLAPEWHNYRGVKHEVAPETLRAVLTAMELPCATEGDARSMLAQLRQARDDAEWPALATAVAGDDIVLPGGLGLDDDTRALLTGEDGARLDARLARRGATVTLRAPDVPGYYRLEAGPRACALAVAPPRGVTLADLAPGRRSWGIAVQLYALRRRGDGGIGDFTALAECARALGTRGADALGVSPVHAPFLTDPGHFSPYAPSSRLFLNPWHVDPAEAIGATVLREIAVAQGLLPELERLERATQMDWPAVARTRMALLRGVFDRGMPDALAQDFRAHRAAAGPALEDHARFDALQAQRAAAGASGHWREWPAELRDARSPAVLAFAREHATEVDFYAFVQWLADRGLAAAQHAARAAGMAVGLISDLAVGTDGGGSHAWSRQHDMLVGLSVGAPPDELNTVGQSWGLTTFSPRALVQHGYAPFIEMLRATLRHAGGLRIDHVLGLNRLWIVPEGAKPDEGAYLRYPLRDLLRIIALESARHRALIVGEDLGTVPEGFREGLAQAGVMGLRVLWFERHNGLFLDPSRWSTDAVAMTGTHDTATVAGWWQARDIDWRERLGIAGGTRAERTEEQRALWAAFRHAGVAEGEPPADAAPVVDAAVRFVARTPAPLAIVPVEDLIGLAEQPNLPGTVDEHPNWRRRLEAPTEPLLEDAAVAARLASLQQERPR